MPELADALTGRYHTVRIYPLSQGEIAGVSENFVRAFLADPAAVAAGAGSSQMTRAEYIDPGRARRPATDPVRRKWPFVAITEAMLARIVRAAP